MGFVTIQISLTKSALIGVNATMLVAEFDKS